MHLFCHEASRHSFDSRDAEKYRYLVVTKQSLIGLRSVSFFAYHDFIWVCVHGIGHLISEQNCECVLRAVMIC